MSLPNYSPKGRKNNYGNFVIFGLTHFLWNNLEEMGVDMSLVDCGGHSPTENMHPLDAAQFS